MSTFVIDFQVQELNFSPLTRGQVDLVYNDGNRAYTLTLRLREGVSTTGYFTEVAWVSAGSLIENDIQAGHYATAFNRDFSNIGGSGNLTAAYTAAGEVTVTADRGTFDSWQYTGNVLIVAGTITNTPQAADNILTVTKSASTGDCSNIQYNATFTGDNSPFDLFVDGSVINAGWDGTSYDFNLSRGIPHSIVVENALGQQAASKTVNTPRSLVSSEISYSLVQGIASSDVIVDATLIGGISPYQYAITVAGATTGSGYQTSNTFQGVLPDQYKIWVQDAYGCETSTIIDVVVAGTESERVRWFIIPEGQSIPFAENVTFDKDNKPNFFNTGSYNENVLTVYRTGQEFDTTDDNIGFQFQSSYPEHLIQLVGNDNSVQVLTPIMIQQNLGVAEKVDCRLFPVPGQESSKTGVYFNGGNNYLPDTTTVDGASPYDGNSPRWAEVGQLVTLDGLGTFEIESTSYDNDRGGYFVVSLITASDTAGIVQVLYDRHPYDLYECYFSPSLLTAFSYLVVDKGFDGSTWDGNAFVSEPLLGITDTIDHLLIEWSDTKNRGDIVFNSGIKYWFRRVGEFYGEFSNNEAEIYAGDSEAYSLSQKTYLDFQVTLEMLSARQVNMLNMASGLKGFKINGITLTRKDPPEITRYDKSNLHTWKCRFAYGTNQIAIQGAEIVLNVNNNTLSGEAPDLSAITLYKNNDGKLVMNNSATLIKQ